MKPNRSTLLMALALACAAPPALVAQKKKPDPNVAINLKKLKTAVGDRKGERDTEATGTIDTLLQGYDSMVKKDKSSVRKALDKILTSPRVRRKPDQKAIYVACATALGRMGADGSKVLVKAFGHAKFKKSSGEENWVDLRAVFVKQIGNTKDPKQIKFLTERALRDPNDPIMAAAGRALGAFEDATEKVRKSIGEDLIKKFGEIDARSRASLDPGDAQVKRDKERLAAISEPWNETLQKLTRQNFRTAEEWMRFWNKNKAKSWK